MNGNLEKSDNGEADGLEKLRNEAFDCVWAKTESVIKVPFSLHAHTYTH